MYIFKQNLPNNIVLIKVILFTKIIVTFISKNLVLFSLLTSVILFHF